MELERDEGATGRSGRRTQRMGAPQQAGVESCTQMSDTGATAKPRPCDEAWDRAMRRGTEASADATQ